MDPGQQFCLRWNNYQSTLQHVFYKLWVSGTFVDASLVVEGRRIDCHKVVLSACSSYFEDILQEHSSQNHPLILLHDMPFTAVEALVAFMYRGEVNVSHAQLESLLQVAEALKVKGLAESGALSNFTKRQLLERCMPLLEQAPPPPAAAAAAAAAFVPNRFVNIPGAITFPTTAIVQPRMASTTLPTTQERNGSAVMKQTSKAVKRLMKNGSRSPGPKKKRPRPDRGMVGSVPSSPGSLNDSPLSDVMANNTPASEPSQPSPVPTLTTSEMLKQEAADETDGELQIDESAGQSPAGSTECDNNSIGTDCDKDVGSEDMTMAVPVEQSHPIKVENNNPLPLETPKLLQQTQTPSSVDGFSGPKERKSIERTYTHLDLEQGIEAVLLGRLTPAKAIAHYHIPRRTFFRRLSAVRKSRGIPSAKENAADQFLNPSGAVLEAKNQLLQAMTKDPYATAYKVKSDKQLLMDTKDTKIKCSKKNASVVTSNNSYLTLLKLAASNNYDTYIKYLKLVAQESGHSKPEEFVEVLRKAHIKEIKQKIDDNRNVATEVSEAALCLVNKNLTTEVPESPLSLLNGNTTTTEINKGSEAPLGLVCKKLVADVPVCEAPINLCNGNGKTKVPEVKVEIEEELEEELEEEDEDDDDDGDVTEESPESPSQAFLTRNLIPASVAEVPQDLLSRKGTANSTSTEGPQNLVSRSNKMTTEVS